MKKSTFKTLFMLESIVCAVLALLFSWAKEPGMAVLFLINANICVLCYYSESKKE